MCRFGRMLVSATIVFMLSAGIAAGRDDADYTILNVFRKTGRINGVALSHDGSRLAITGRGSVVEIWDTRTGERLAKLEGHDREVRVAAFSPDSRVLATGSDDDFVVLWDTETWKEARRYDIDTAVLALSFSPDGRTLAVADHDEAVFLLDPGAGNRLLKLTGHAENVRSLAFSGDGSTLAGGGEDRRVVLWDVKSGSKRMTIEDIPAKVPALAVSPDGTMLFTGGDDGRVTIREIPSGKVRHVLEGHRHIITGINYLEAGKVMATLENKQVAFGEQSCSVKLRETGSWREISTLRGACAGFHSFTPDGRYLAVGTGDRAMVYERTR